MNVLGVQIKPAANRRLNIDSCFHSTVRRPTENDRVKHITQYDLRNTQYEIILPSVGRRRACEVQLNPPFSLAGLL